MSYLSAATTICRSQGLGAAKTGATARLDIDAAAANVAAIAAAATRIVTVLIALSRFLPPRLALLAARALVRRGEGVFAVGRPAGGRSGLRRLLDRDAVDVIAHAPQRLHDLVAVGLEPVLRFMAFDMHLDCKLFTGAADRSRDGAEMSGMKLNLERCDRLRRGRLHIHGLDFAHMLRQRLVATEGLHEGLAGRRQRALRGWRGSERGLRRQHGDLDALVEHGLGVGRLDCVLPQRRRDAGG